MPLPQLRAPNTGASRAPPLLRGAVISLSFLLPHVCVVAGWTPLLRVAGLPATLRATHRSLFDGSLQGIHRNDRPAFSFQGHPEASPGPHDAAGLFDHFIGLMREHGRAKG